MVKCCRACAFRQETSPTQGEPSSLGECRRSHPTTEHYGIRKLPGDYWCGDFQPGPNRDQVLLAIAWAAAASVGAEPKDALDDLSMLAVARSVLR